MRSLVDPPVRTATNGCAAVQATDLQSAKGAFLKKFVPARNVLFRKKHGHGDLFGQLDINLEGTFQRFVVRLHQRVDLDTRSFQTHPIADAERILEIMVSVGGGERCHSCFRSSNPREATFDWPE